MLQMGDTAGPHYTAPKISVISYLFGTFSLLIMGNTERPRYTGFRSLSVRGITALQCIVFVAGAMVGIVRIFFTIVYPIFLFFLHLSERKSSFADISCFSYVAC